MSDYQLYLNFEVAKLIKPIRGQVKRDILHYLDFLKAHPFSHGDFRRRKEARDVEVKVIGNYSIYFFTDHAVKEVKVIDVQKAEKS
ncbi:MAG: hypothetical protein ACQKBV_11495 [Puniceicoccales bacterium]